MTKVTVLTPPPKWTKRKSDPPRPPKPLSPPRPGDWRASIERFYDLGLPSAELVDCVKVAFANKKVSDKGVFRYMAGCAWRVLKDIQEAAREIITAETVDEPMVAEEPVGADGADVPVQIVERETVTPEHPASDFTDDGHAWLARCEGHGCGSQQHMLKVLNQPLDPDGFRIEDGHLIGGPAKEITFTAPDAFYCERCRRAQDRREGITT